MNISDRLEFFRNWEEAVIRSIESSIGITAAKQQNPTEAIPGIIGDLSVAYSRTSGLAIYRNDGLSSVEKIVAGSDVSMTFFQSLSALIEENLSIFGREEIMNHLKETFHGLSSIPAPGTNQEILDTFEASKNFLSLYDKSQIVRAVYWFSRYAEYTAHGQFILRLTNKQPTKSPKEKNNG